MKMVCRIATLAGSLYSQETQDHSVRSYYLRAASDTASPAGTILQVSSSKYQIPNLKQIPNAKFQNSNKVEIEKFGNYDLNIVWSLGLGFWDLPARGGHV